MKAERWEAVERVLAHALMLDARERPAYVAAMCGGDDELAKEVLSLAQEHERDPEYLERAPVWFAETAASAIDEMPERIGEYRILRTIGRGGMGQVYQAERIIDDVHQTVAIKVMRRGLDTADFVERFRLERRILASLHHENIGRLYDVGATEDGLPYLVMEYIDGVPLLEYCDLRRLGIPERVRLFHHICAAVQHAHQSLVVHRDIKPGNILVTADGVPKLLDFGIAKILATDGTEDQLTRGELRLLTPEYSSPEQIRGEPVTTSCDVFALGVLLHRLLAGRHPLADAQTTPRELERRITQVDAPPPSSQVTREAAEARGTSIAVLRKQLQGDLDTVALKAQRKDPAARYASALSLAEDLERHASGRPVLARPATLGYHVQKFVARNRASVAAAIALVVVLVGASGVTLYQSQRIRQEAARSERERDKALQVSGFLLEMFGTTGPDQPTGDSVTARQLLDRRRAMVHTAYKDPELRAEMMYVLAEGYEKLGLFDDAEPLAKEALATRRAHYGGPHPDIVASLNLVGWLRHQRRDFAAAEPLLREAVEMGRTVFGANGDARLARALNDLGVLREAQEKYDEAATLYRESIAMRQRGSGDQNLGLAITTSNLSVVLYRRGDLPGAVEMAQSALDAFRLVLGEDHARTIIVQSNLATFYGVLGDHVRAAQEIRLIMERRKRLLGPRHPDVAHSMTLLARQLISATRYDEAEVLLNEATDMQRTAPGSAPDNLATTLRLTGDVHRITNRHEVALPYYDEAVAINRRVLGPNSRPLLESLLGRGESLFALGRADSARASLEEADRIAVTALPAGHANTIRIRIKLIETLQQQGRTAEAQSKINELQQSLTASTLPANDTVRLRALKLLGK